MLACWSEIPERRPLFDELEESISNLMDKSAAEQYILLNKPFLEINVEQSITKQNDSTDNFQLEMMESSECESSSIQQMNVNIQQPPDLIAHTKNPNLKSTNCLDFANNPLYFPSHT